MSEGKHHVQETIRNFRMVRIEGRAARSVAKDSLTPGVLRRCPVPMAEWADKLDAFLSFNERDVLTHAGRLRMDVAQKLTFERFEAFDANRRAAGPLATGDADIAQLEQMEKVAQRRKKGREDA